MGGSASRRVLGGLGVMALVGAGLVVTAPGVGAQTFNPGEGNTAGTGTFAVPAGVCQVIIAAWGGSGATSLGNATNAGGLGGRIRADFLVSPGDSLQVTVGASAPPVSGVGGAGGKGYNTGGAGNVGAEGAGGGGGGSSAVVLNGGVALLIAGGGGGGGGVGSGGNGGVAVGFPPDPGSGSQVGSGGAGGSAQGSRGDGTPGANLTFSGGGGAGAAPGAGGSTVAGAGGGGGGNFDSNTTDTSLSDPGALGGAGGQVTITTADPGVGCPPVLQVKKVVVGTSASGFSVRVDCTRPAPAQPVSVGTKATDTTVDNVGLPYTPDGAPDAAHAPSGWVVKDGTWQLAQGSLTNSTCTATETVTGGAQSVSYACVWTPGTSDHAPGVGCPGASSGPGAQPATVTFEGNGDTGQVTVTNTFPVSAAAAVTVAPKFTG